jgi:hypothetical protein
MSDSHARETTTRHATHRTAWIVGALTAVLLIVVLVRLFERKPVAAHGAAARSSAR